MHPMDSLYRWVFVTLVMAVMTAGALYGCAESSTGLSVPCTSDLDCPDGYLCDTGKHECVPRDVIPDGDTDENDMVVEDDTVDTDADKADGDTEEVADIDEDTDPSADGDTEETDGDTEQETEDIEAGPPVISVPESIMFDTPVVGNNQQKNLVITNTGESLLEITGIATGEGTPAVFSVTATSQTEIAPGSSAIATVRYAPDDEMPDSGTVVVTSNDPVRPSVEVALTVQFCEGGGELSASPNQISFPAVETGGTGQISLVNLDNDDLSLCVNISQISVNCITGPDPCPFSITEPATVPASIDPASRMVMKVAFSPESEGTYQGLVTVVNDSQNKPNMTIYLSGSAGTSTLEAQPSSLAFGDVNVDGLSQQQLTVVNTGILDVTLENVYLQSGSSSNFHIENTAQVAGTVLTPGDDLVFNVNYQPLSQLEESGAVVITSDATIGNRILVQVTGSGVISSMEIDPSAVSFGNIAVSATERRTMRIINHGATALELAGVGLDPAYGAQSPFAVEGLEGVTFPYAVPADNGELSFTVAFTPPAEEFYENRLLVTKSEAPDSPVAVSLTGRGVAPMITIRRADGQNLGSRIDFGEVVVDAPQTVTLIVKNEGNANLIFDAVEMTGDSDADFTVSSDSLEPLAPFAERSFEVTFLANPPGREAAGTLVFNTNDPNYPSEQFELKAQIVAPELEFSVGGNAVTNYDFGSMLVNYTAGPITLKLHNVGFGALQVSNINFAGLGDGAFALELVGGGLPRALGPFITTGQEIIVHLRFTPVAVESYTENLRVTCNDYRGSLQIFTLDGAGVECPDGWHDANGIAGDGPRGDGCEYECSYTNNGTEACDGLDNNCNNQTDEGFPLGQECTGRGICGAGTYVCSEDQQSVRCSSELDQAQPEICDNQDNNCNGVVDEEPESLSSCSSTPGLETHCVNGECSYSCPDGQHLCGEACVTDNDLDHCGEECSPCPAVEHGTAVCASSEWGYYCDFECDEAYRRSGNLCILRNEPSCCGASCTDCLPAPDDGQATCYNGECRYFCNAGFHHPTGDSFSCVPNDTIDCCGNDCEPCAPPLNASGQCVYDSGVSDYVCQWECNPTYHGCPVTNPTGCFSDASKLTCGDRCDPCPNPQNGAGVCVASGDSYACDVECNLGFHGCFGLCVMDNNINTCGDRCDPCPTPDNGVPTCSLNSETQQYACGGSCYSGYHFCGDNCVSNYDIENCGNSCEPCQDTQNGSVSCNGSSCVYTCDGGFHACSDGCFPYTDPLHCGTQCNICDNPEHGSATCDGVVCGIECNPGYHVCSDNNCYLETDIQHCGVNCQVCEPGDHQSAECNSGACEYTCDDNYYDWNGSSSDGCEEYCIITGSVDNPDDAFTDTNCDGIDGMADMGVFVAPGDQGGSNLNSGTKNDPVLTIARAFEIAATTSRKHVYVSFGIYRESDLALPPGVSIFGGYSQPDGWSRSNSNQTTIMGYTTGLKILNPQTSAMRVDHLTIQTQDLGSPGQSYYGVYVLNGGDALTLSNLDITTSPGGNGQSGLDGALEGVSGNAGGGGSGSSHGAAGVNASCPAANGGNGGNGATSYNGYGSDGANSPGGAPGGDGGDSNDSKWGKPGAPGGDAAAGANGDGASAVGSIVDNFWIGGIGGTGQPGGPGIGGGGGGGGGAYLQHDGGGGGGGGAGGCGGDPGQGGKGGGGSFGVFLVNASPAILNCSIATSNGGPGGMGGAGRNGGSGAGGGIGAQGQDGAFSSAGDGGTGGTGSNGGKGGNGGGGAGGASFCVFRVGASSNPVYDTALNVCNNGNGGSGGQASGGNGNPGETGASGVKNDPPLSP